MCNPEEQWAPHRGGTSAAHSAVSTEQVAGLRNDCLPFAVDPDPLPIHSVILRPTPCSFQGFDSKEVGIPVLSRQSYQIKSRG